MKAVPVDLPRGDHLHGDLRARRRGPPGRAPLILRAAPASSRSAARAGERDGRADRRSRAAPRDDERASERAPPGLIDARPRSGRRACGRTEKPLTAARGHAARIAPASAGQALWKALRCLRGGSASAGSRRRPLGGARPPRGLAPSPDRPSTASCCCSRLSASAPRSPVPSLDGSRGGPCLGGAASRARAPSSRLCRGGSRAWRGGRRRSPCTSMFSIFGEWSGNVRSTPTPNDCLRTVKVSRTPAPWRLITIPSKTWTRRRWPSITWKCTRTVSPALNCGRSPRAIGRARWSRSHCS